MFLHLLLVRFPNSLDCESRSLGTWLAFAQLSTCWSVGVCVCSKLGCKMTAVMCCFWKGCFVSSWGRRASSGLGREGGREGVQQPPVCKLDTAACPHHWPHHYIIVIYGWTITKSALILLGIYTSNNHVDHKISKDDFTLTPKALPVYCIC